MLFPTFCSGENQSPIDIQTDNIVPTSFDEKLQTLHYSGVRLGSLLENGHTVQLQLPKNSTGEFNLPIPAIQGGGLNGIYLLDHIHFHWGHDDSHGSEHLIDSKPYV